MTSNEILYEKKEHVGIITVNRPEKLNSFTDQMLKDLIELLFDLENDTDVRCVVLTGTGRSFSTGSDLGEASAFSPFEMALKVSHERLLTDKLETFRAPIIAVINGYAIGGGLEFAMACDLRLASEKAKLGLSEVNVGTIAGAGGTYRLAELIGESRAKMLEYTGKNILADEAYRIGLVDEVYSPEELLPKALELAETIASKAPLAVELAKKVIRHGRTYYAGGCDLAPIVGSEDFKEAMTAFVEKRPNKGYNRR